MLANVLPGPKHSYAIPAEEFLEVKKKTNVLTKSSAIPQYLKRTGYVPVNTEDFGDGGAFPEIHIVQYPLNMGKPGVSSTAVISVNVDEKGQVQYDSLVKQGTNRNRIVQTSLNDMKEKERDIISVALPEEKEEQETADRTRQVLEGLLMSKINSSKASTVVHSSDIVEPTYIRYTPNPDAPGFNPAAKQRVIRMVEAQVDPMEPPKHKSKKVPRGPPSPPVPVLHSPPRKLTVADQQAWQIPPCVSNWKNARGYTIPLDKRLAADGRGLQEVTINDKFAMLSEALYISERKASEDLRIRSQIRKKMALQEKEERESELREMALKARMERAGLGGASAIDINARGAEEPYLDDLDMSAPPISSHYQERRGIGAYDGHEVDGKDDRDQRDARRGRRRDERREYDSRDRYEDKRHTYDDRRNDDERYDVRDLDYTYDRRDSSNHSRMNRSEDHYRSTDRREGLGRQGSSSYHHDEREYDRRDNRQSSREDYDDDYDRRRGPTSGDGERGEGESTRYGESEEERVARQQRERLRIERRKEREREIRLENMKGNMRKNKIDRDSGRDISEKIALGMHRGTGQLTGEALYDSRLFNQSAGMDSGFGADDEYSTYTKPLFDKGEATSMYRPKKDDSGTYGDVDAQLEKLKDTSRFKPDKGFKGTQGASGGGRDAPVQFEMARSSSSGTRAREDDRDPFGIGDILTSKKARYDDDDE